MPCRHDYDFRQRDLLAVERLSPTPNAARPAGCVLDEDFEIVAAADGERLTRYMARDLCRFLTDAFGLCLRVRFVDDPVAALKTPKKKIFLFDETAADVTRVSSAMAGAFHITVTPENITVFGKTGRGTAQGAYYIEDMLRLRGDGKLEEECAEHAPLFSPRMAHPGLEVDTFSDNYLAACAHAGMDAVIVYISHLNSNLHGYPDAESMWPGAPKGYCDFNNLVHRAAGYGLDVYVYSWLLCDRHPDDPDAAEYYDASFGELFRQCPGIKGIIFVGETFEFPSKDERTSGIRCQKRPKGEKRPSPGWFPCSDYPDFVKFVRDIIKKEAPGADIVFWTYNWPWAPKEDRLRLIRNLPADVTLLVTYDVHGHITAENGITYSVDDYSLSYIGPTSVFREEAGEAKAAGRRVYAMANTGGRTWDNGLTPYLPAPGQWQKRYAALRRSRGEDGLCGLMGSHHYGWVPSFLTLFEKNAFTSGGLPDGEMLARIAARDYGREAKTALAAWDCFDRAMSRVVAAAVDQYGPFRSGPSYPLLFDQQRGDLHFPSVEWAWQKGFGIWNPVYPDDVFSDPAFLLLRLARMREARDLFAKGCGLLDQAIAALGAPKGSEVSRQAANARMLLCSYTTAAHVLTWIIARELLFALRREETHPCDGELYAAIAVDTPAEDALAARMEDIARAEDDNVARALTCWEEDSLLGFEPAMEYVFDDRCAAWKRQVCADSLEKLRAFLREKEEI